MNEPDDLDKLTRELFEAGRAERPSASRKQKILDALQDGSGRATGSRVVSALRWFGALALLVGLILGLRAWLTHGAEQPTPRQDLEHASASERVSFPLPSRADASSGADAPTGADAPAVANTTHSEGAQEPLAEKKGAGQKRAPAPEVPDLLAREVQLLDSARGLLASDPRACLATLQRYRREFPNGTLTVEADLVRIEAHLKAGSRESAEQVARRLIASNPDSPVASRALRLLETAP